MSSDETWPQPPEDQATKFLRNAALAGVIICPIAMLLPPRKMDVRFYTLAGAFGLSANHLAASYTGNSLLGRFQNRVTSMADIASLPAGAQETQRLLREHKEREAAMKKSREEEESGLAKKVEEVWLGGEDKDWKKKRIEEHQKQFDEGRGMTGIITDQISDVLTGNWGRKDGGEKK